MRQRRYLCCWAILAGIVCAAKPASLPQLGCKSEDTEFRSLDKGCFDLRSSLVWIKLSSVPLPHPRASELCGGLDREKRWRLPTAEEYEGVSERRRGKTHFSFSVLDFFWSSSAGENGPLAILPVDDVGTSESLEQTDSLRLAKTVCVRRVPKLTEREFQVLRCTAFGLTDREIGEHLNIGRDEVRRILRSIVASLDLPERDEDSYRAAMGLQFVRLKFEKWGNAYFGF